MAWYDVVASYPGTILCVIWCGTHYFLLESRGVAVNGAGKPQGMKYIAGNMEKKINNQNVIKPRLEFLAGMTEKVVAFLLVSNVLK